MPLPRFLRRRPVQLLVGLLAVAAVATVVGGGDERDPAGAVGPEADAVLVVDDVAFELDLETCFVGNDSFVVAGHGADGSDDFRVLASPSEIELAFGITDQSAPVPEDRLWLVTTEPISWSADGTSLIARVELVDRRDDEPIPHRAELRVDCGVTS